MFELVLILSVTVVGVGVGVLLAGPLGAILGGLMGIFICLMAMTPGGLMVGVGLLIMGGLIMSGHLDAKQQKAEKAKLDLEREQNLQKNSLRNLYKYTLKEIRFRWADWKHACERGDTEKEQRHYKSRYLKSVASVITVLEKIMSDYDGDITLYWRNLYKTALWWPTDSYPEDPKFYQWEELWINTPEPEELEEELEELMA